MNKTPFKYALSNIVKMDIIEESGVKIIDLEFKFARYQLVLDDPEQTKKLIELIVGKIVWPEKKKVEQEKVKMPSFSYKSER